jgi:hypothetical protein
MLPDIEIVGLVSPTYLAGPTKAAPHDRGRSNPFDGLCLFSTSGV